MSGRAQPPLDTRERLLDEAERLFADRGVAGPSVRDIITAAHANLGAITYHFGTREALVREVIARRMRPLNEERVRLLEDAERSAGKKRPSLEKILRAVIAPSIRLLRENPAFMRIAGRMLTDPDRKLRKHAEAERFIERFKSAIARALPDLPRAEIEWRLHFLRGAVIHTWTSAETLSEISGGLCKIEGDDEAIIERLVAFGAAGLRARVAIETKKKTKTKTKARRRGQRT